VVLWSAGIVVLVGAAVLSDLPQHPSRATQVSDATSVVKQINSDVGACVYAVKEAFAIQSALAAHTVSAANQGRVPGLLRDDQNACAFTDSSINDLAGVEVPGSSAGKDLADLVNTVTLWSSSDALGSIEAIQTLSSKPGDVPAHSRLASYSGTLESDRVMAEAQLSAADQVLRAQLPALVLPVLRPPG
jgi:hypothetical protein